MKNVIISMLIMVGFSTFFVKDEKSFYKWVSWCGIFVAIRLLLFYLFGA